MHCVGDVGKACWHLAGAISLPRAIKQLEIHEAAAIASELQPLL